jgi:hypothetical protein
MNDVLKQVTLRCEEWRSLELMTACLVTSNLSANNIYVSQLSVREPTWWSNSVLRQWSCVAYATEAIVLCGTDAWRHYEAMNISSENTDAIPSHFSCWSIYRTGNQITLIACLLNRRNPVSEVASRSHIRTEETLFYSHTYLQTAAFKIRCYFKNKFVCKNEQ